MNNIDIVKRSFQAFVESDRAANEAVIAQDFHFTSPLDNRIDRATYFDRCWPNNEWIVDFKFVRLVADGDEVIVTYDGTNASGGLFRNTEVLTIRDEKIVEVEVYFGWNVPHQALPGGFVSDA
jgi:ketosteroid isomerase-like protein